MWPCAKGGGLLWVSAKFQVGNRNGCGRTYLLARFKLRVRAISSISTIALGVVPAWTLQSRVLRLE